VHRVSIAKTSWLMVREGIGICCEDHPSLNGLYCLGKIQTGMNSVLMEGEWNWIRVVSSILLWY